VLTHSSALHPLYVCCVSVIEMQTVRMNFLYRQGNTLFFMDPTTFEQVELDSSLAPGHQAHYLIGPHTA